MKKVTYTNNASAIYELIATLIFYIMAIACYFLCPHNADIFGFIDYFTSFFDGIVTQANNAETIYHGGKYARYIMFVAFMAPVFIIPLSLSYRIRNDYMLRVYDKTLLEAVKFMIFKNIIAILIILFWLFFDMRMPYGSGGSFQYSSISISFLAFANSITIIGAVMFNIGILYHMVVLKNKEFLKIPCNKS